MIGEVLELRRLIKNRKLSRDELEALQNRRLREVIQHAYKNVPYYHELFKTVGLLPEDISTVEDLKHIPITTKNDLRSTGIGKIMAKDVKLSSCISVRTSGSTGKPFTSYITRDEARTRRLIEFRTLLSIGFHPRDRLAVLGEPPSRTRLHQLLGFYQNKNITDLSPIEDQIEILKKMQPTVLWAYPSALRALLHNVDYHLSKLVRPRILITSAEVLDEVLREKILADMNLEIFNFYGAYEIGRIAAECRAHEGLHINSDHVIIERLDGDQRSEPGTRSVVVITCLNSFAMPLIRYQLGDICTLTEKNCSCGCSFPIICSLQGRENEMTRLPSGKILPSPLFGHILKDFSSINQFRIIQERLDHFVLQLVFQENPKNDVLAKIRSRIMEFLGEPVTVDIQLVDFIEEEKQKFRIFISKLPKSDYSGRLN